MGVFGDNFRLRKALLADYRSGGERPFEFTRPVKLTTEIYPKEASIELEAFPVFESFLGGAPGLCVGGGSGAARVNPYFQVVTELSGCLIMNLPHADQSGDLLYYGGGLRWTPRAAHRFSPFAQVMFGGTKVTQETDNIPLRTKLLQEWSDGDGVLAHYPRRSDWSVEITRNGPALGFGGGFRCGDGPSLRMARG
jgi:hypothetical protein